MIYNVQSSIVKKLRLAVLQEHNNGTSVPSSRTGMYLQSKLRIRNGISNLVLQYIKLVEFTSYDGPRMIDRPLKNQLLFGLMM
jgi:hypothetical protein